MKETDKLGKLRCRWENNITGREWTGFSGLRARNTADSCKHNNKLSCTTPGSLGAISFSVMHLLISP